MTKYSIKPLYDLLNNYRERVFDCTRKGARDAVPHWQEKLTFIETVIINVTGSNNLSAGLGRKFDLDPIFELLEFLGDEFSEQFKDGEFVECSKIYEYIFILLDVLQDMTDIPWEYDYHRNRFYISEDF